MFGNQIGNLTSRCTFRRHFRRRVKPRGVSPSYPPILPLNFSSSKSQSNFFHFEFETHKFLNPKNVFHSLFFNAYLVCCQSTMIRILSGQIWGQVKFSDLYLLLLLLFLLLLPPLTLLNLIPFAWFLPFFVVDHQLTSSFDDLAVGRFRDALAREIC